jgi:DNA modification methylase
MTETNWWAMTSKNMQSAGLRSELKARGRHRREKLADMAATPLRRTRNDLCPSLSLVQRDPQALIVPARNTRKIDQAHVQRVVHSISIYGFTRPVIIDENDTILDGVISRQAAIALNLPEIPCIVADHLTASEKRALRLAINRLQEKGTWDLIELKAELIELVDAGIEIEDIGFSIAEFDQITLDDDVEPLEKGPLAPKGGAKAIARAGDVYVFEGGHRLICGDATDPEDFAKLMRVETARLLSTDQPYNVPIVGHVTKGDHREFAMASGEMTSEQFLAFNQTWIGAALPHLCDGSLIGTFIDWRGYHTVHTAALGAGLTAMNLIVWAKTNAGLGSLYRSQHELFALYKKGMAPHVNNIQLGKTGRWRSNVWTYPGASSVGSDSRGGLEFHPTVKPEAMCADAILDLTNRGEIVLDPFLGSGSTLIAAQRTGRRCFGIELDPLYVDVAVRRFQQVFGQWAVLEATGGSFEMVARQRQDEG